MIIIINELSSFLFPSLPFASVPYFRLMKSSLDVIYALQTVIIKSWLKFTILDILNNFLVIDILII